MVVDGSAAELFKREVLEAIDGVINTDVAISHIVQQPLEFCTVHISPSVFIV